MLHYQNQHQKLIYIGREFTRKIGNLDKFNNYRFGKVSIYFLLKSQQYNIKQSKQTIKNSLNQPQTMHFYNQYKDLFEVGNNPNIAQRQKLRIDNQLFIDRPYVPAYSKEYQLSSKLRQLNRDYNDFESQVKELQQLSQIPKRSQSRRKQTQNNDKNGGNYMLNHHMGDRNNIGRGNTNNIKIGYAQQNIQSLSQKYPNSIKPKRPHHQQSTILDHYQDNNSTSINDLEYRIGTNHSMVQKRKLKNDIRQSIRRENDGNVQKVGISQNNNPSKQSQINDIFNWKTQQSPKLYQSPVINPTNLSKHKHNTPILQQPPQNQVTFGVRSSTQNNNQSPNNSYNQQNSNLQQNIYKPHQYNNNFASNSYNHANRKMGALERRKIAKEKINQRRQKLKQILKSRY